MLKSKWLVGVVLMTICALGRADVTDGLDDMFFATGNEPAIYQSQRRLGVDLGTMRLRAPISRFNVVNLTPPQLRAGCGGIDMYGGSFTFINDEQFRQLLRQIGANALGYAFKLALKSMCNSCDSVLTGLRELGTELNKMQVDTCRWSKGIVNSVASSLGYKAEEEEKLRGVWDASFGDGFDAIKSMFDNPGEGLSGGDASGADPNNPDVGNFTWNALVAADAGGSFSYVPGSVTHNEMLLNIAGTVILRAPAAAEAEEGDVEKTLERRLTYEELKYGKTQDSTGLADVLPLFECDEAAQCLNPTDAGDWSFTGVSDWADATLQAAADHMANPATSAAPHAAAMQNFLGSLPLTVAKHMQFLQGDGEALDTYVNHVREYVGAAYASSLGLVMVDTIRAAYSRTDTPDIPESVRQNLIEFERDAKEDRRAVLAEYSDVWRKTEELVTDLYKRMPDRGFLIQTGR